MEGLQDIRTYQEFKAATDREVYNQAEGFVRLGYLLRRAEDTDILLESGYKTVTEFARAEYGLTETYVSRYININRRYSEGGYSDRLMEKFRGFGLAKLADMLTLPDEVVEVMPAEATRAEIQEIKRELVQEQQVTDLEVIMERQGTGDEDILARMMKEYYHDAGKLEEYREMHAALREPDPEKRKRKLFDALAPAGDAVKMARVPGTGRLMLTIRGMEQPPELLNVRSGDKKSYTWEELHERLKALFGTDDPIKSWETVYQENYPDPRGPEKIKRKTAVVGIAKAGSASTQRITSNKEGVGKTEAPEEKETEHVPEERIENQEISGEPEEQPEEHKIAPVQEDREESALEAEEMKEETEAAEELSAHEDSQEQAASAENTKEKEKGSAESRAEKKAERDSARQQAIECLKREALEMTEEIHKALERGYYNMARMDAKKLLAILEAVRKELDRKDVPGQMEIKEFIEQEEAKEAERDSYSAGVGTGPEDEEEIK